MQTTGMRRSTRAHPYNSVATEQAPLLREQRLRDRTATTERLQHAEENVDNLAFDIKYTPQNLEMMLMAYHDDDGVVEALQETRVRLLFARHQAWKLGTLFRNVWCKITVFQVGQLAELGWTREQIDAHNVQPALGIDIFALLCHVWSFM